MRRERAMGVVFAAACAVLVMVVAAREAASDGAAPAADPMSPVGLWTTFDDATGKARSLVRIVERGGALYGSIVKLINPKDGDPNPLCDQCKGAKKDKPVVGMTIIERLTPDGDEWSGGTILDPESGNVYKVYLQVQPGGKKMKVRGYIGISLLGRTQWWVRAN